MKKFDTRLNITVDKETKEKAEQILNELGLGLSAAIRLFFNKVIELNSIPFEIINNKCNVPSCNKKAKPHWDNGLYCGNNRCDEHFEEMRQECRKRSY